MQKPDDREFDLAVREAELARREAELKRAEEERASLPRVSADYFRAGQNDNEEDWWAKQLGRAR